MISVYSNSKMRIFIPANLLDDIHSLIHSNLLSVIFALTLQPPYIYTKLMIWALVRHKITLTWNCGIKFFSLQILVGKTLPLKILDDDSLSSLSILRNSRWRPRCQKITQIQVLLYNVPLKMNTNAMFPYNFSMHYYI